ncbi:Na(+)/H(+) antiporter subunit D [Pararhodospirillum oryzae]|uniref:Na(+)/H(+) antiporter subunit D n=1 Tax=Pararhodospirillum oryzae TaxID=478448 RepID=A0A512HBH3_9PROT|nr:Na(+)/H(+) antiporter subunit D [Pararhodospirillum oryzae]GEO82804.1 Na(+)/H(+) antiporter subunit D [Pararhodospirillum oryzae]
MTIESLPPGLILIVGGLLLPLIPARVRPVVLLGLPLLTLAALWRLPDGAVLTLSFLDLSLVPVKADAVSRLFGTVFTLMSFAGGLFALKQPRVLELSAALVYAGSAVGCAFAGDFLSLFVFWELMALASTLVIWSSDQPGAARAGLRYVLMHLLGGAVLMAGLVGHVAASGSLAVASLDPGTLPGLLILGGLLLNAGAPPFSAWLPDAYPEASYSGSVFLSAFTTKTAVLVLFKTFAGTEALIWIGLFMVFYGILYALLENDMRRILSYSIINQVGFMVCGIGIGTPLALNGAAAHAFAHILYKALLMMSAGSVLLMTGGRRKCTDLGGLFHSMPLTTVCGTIGALAISAFPLTSGFVSKSMIGAGAADQGMAWVWLALEAASAGVFLHAGIKFPWFVFFNRDQGLRPADPPWPMQGAMIFLATLCVAIGVWPQPLYALLPFPVSYVPYTGSHVVAQLQLLLFAGLAFFVLLPQLQRTRTLSLDFDWFYRRPLVRLAQGTLALGRVMSETVGAPGLARAKNVAHRLGLLHGPLGLLGRPWPTSLAVTVVLVLLGAALLIAYIHQGPAP